MPAFRVRSIVPLTVVLAAGVLAACSSSGGGTNNSNSGTGSGSSSNAPIKILDILPATGQVSFPEYLAAAQAATSEINAAGGVNGHPIELNSCDFVSDPNKEVACFRQAVQDKVSAVVSGPVYLQTAEDFKLLADAKIPYIGGPGISQDELSSPITYGVAGTIGDMYGDAKALLDAGVKHPALVRCDTGSCVQSEGYFKDALKLLSGGTVSLVRSVVVSLTQVDLTATAAAAVRGGVDGVAFTSVPTQTASLVKGLRQGGFNGAFSTSDTDVTPSVVQSLGDLANGVHVVHILTPIGDTSNPAVSEYLADIKKYQSGANTDDGGFNAWWAVKLFAAIAKTASSTDAAGILAAIQNAAPGTFSTDGAAPPLPVTSTSPVPAFPNMGFDPEVKITNSATVYTGSFVNPFVKS